MISIFAGTDNFESYNEALKHAKKISNESNSEFKVIDADEIYDVSQFTQLLEGLGMFGGSFTVLAKRLFKNKKLLNYVTDNFQNLNNYDLVIWEDSKLDSRLKFVKDNKNKMLLLNFELPKEYEFKKWLKDKAKENGIDLSVDLINYLAQYTEVNKYRAISEIEKISIYLNSQKKNKLTLEELEKLLGVSASGDIWKFIESFSTKNKKKALKEMGKLTQFESNTAYLIAMIDRELNLLAQIKILQENKKNISEIKAHPFVLKKASENSKNFSLSEIRRLYRKLMDLDFAVKSGDIEEKLGLTLFLNLL